MGVKIEYKGHRLINTKYPPIALFDDVASPEEFELLYAIQALTNPRLRDEVGDICLIDPAEIPFDCLRGRSYAVAPFTHINPKGGRFNDRLFGALYVADNAHTAALEVKFHQQQYWQNIEGLEYDRFLFRGLLISHQSAPIYHVCGDDSAILNPDCYAAAQQLARKVKKEGFQAIEYPSVRAEDALCWAIFTPKPITDVVQSYLVEMIWNGEQIAEVNTVENLGV
ncbi:hypothetical protein C5F63_09000 [Photobacterium damselae subsp. damselae]|uniref:RES family NAD+ phosphorylase n=1 Tax=Photobacterium damselae TaxID=38293 RepID=UPI000D04C9A0|nr:RES family NAD+ phosphorylase [Photobacterium damselae]PSB87967.1 hypothetical protein C5F63_09000 [Photobacterium damselae subsp. damselae]